MAVPCAPGVWRGESGLFRVRLQVYQGWQFVVGGALSMGVMRAEGSQRVCVPLCKAGQMSSANSWPSLPSTECVRWLQTPCLQRMQYEHAYTPTNQSLQRCSRHTEPHGCASLVHVLPDTGHQPQITLQHQTH